MAKMWRDKPSTIAILLVSAALALMLVSTELPVAAAADNGNNGDTMYDLEGSGDDGDRVQGSGGGSGGSGSGEPPTRDCQVPPSGTFPEPTNFEDQVLPEIRCHLACVELVMEQENSTLEISTDYDVWPMISDSVLESNCSLYQKIEECKQGCLVHSLQPSLRDGRCALQCGRTCNQSCSGEMDCWIEGSSCTKTCSESYCSEGCRLATTDINQPDGVLPLSPSSKPHLFAPQVATGAGVYTIDPRSTPTDSENSEQMVERPLTSFIVRAVHEATNRIAFFWLRSLDDEVNLGAFSCLSDVLVQYATVNEYGRSRRWSPSAEIDVYGADGIPSPENPDRDTIRFAVRPDQRFGFWKHAVLTAYWDRPRGFHYVSHYTVTLHPSSYTCGRRQIILSVPRELTQADIMAEFPSQGPVDGCVYEISVASVAVSGMGVPLVRKVLHSVKVDNPVPIDFQCVRSWSDVAGRFQFQLNWTIPDSPHLHDAITKFHILLTFISPGAPPETRDAAEILFDSEKSEYFYLTRRVRFGATGSYYRIQMVTRSSLYDQILVPNMRVCEYEALPPPPDPPTTISVNNNSVQFQSADLELGMGILTLYLEWNVASGNISSYEVSLFELRSGAEDFSEENIQEIFHPDQLKLSRESASLTIEVPTSTENGCLYAQVRSISAHGSISNWSVPQCVYIAGLELPTMTTPTTTPTGGDGESNESGSTIVLPMETLYIVLSVAGVVLVATVILTFFVCLACYQNRKVAKKTQLMKQAAKQSSFQKAMSPATTPTKLSYQSPKLRFQEGVPVPSVSLQKSTEDWELHPCQIVVDNKLGHGGFGDVYQGTLRGGVGIYKSNGPQIIRVAVKILRAASSLDEKRDFLDHIEQAKLVAKQLTTPRVVKMIGCVTLHEPHCLVTELPARGDLLTYLTKARKKILNPELEDSDAEFLEEPVVRYVTWDSVAPKAAATEIEESFKRSAASHRVEPKDLLNFSIQIASGMEYLSAIGVVHGDLACRNMYLDDNYAVKISDFGINLRERGKHRLYVKVGHARLPLRWMAPEAIAEGQMTVASDVWAFGVTLWEIVTLGGFPYIDVSNKDLLQCLMGGRQLKRPSNCANEIYAVMKRCWKADKLDRPTFTTLHKTLQDYSASEDLSNLISLQNIDSQNAYYQPKRHQNARGISGERLERRLGEEQNDRDEKVLIENGASPSDALIVHRFSGHILPQILEDEAEDTTDEQETSKEDTEPRQMKETGSRGGKPSRLEEGDHGTLNSDTTEGFVSGAVTPTSLEEGQTDDLKLRSETTTPDSGYNMSQS